MNKDASKPTRGSRKAASVATPTLQIVPGDPKSFDDLTASEIRMLRAFRKVSDECQDHITETLELVAKTQLLMRPAPKASALRLVSNGGSQ
jgi:hypothetical protein